MPFIGDMSNIKNYGVLRKLIADLTGIKAAEVPYNAILDDLGLDSLQAVELAEKLKHDFLIDIPSNMLIVSKLQDILERLDAAPKQPEPVSAPKNLQPVSTPQDTGPSRLLNIIAQAAGMAVEWIEETHTLGQLLDDLSILEMEQDVEDAFPSMRDKQLNSKMTIGSLMKLLDIKPPTTAKAPKSSSQTAEIHSIDISATSSKPTRISRLLNPLSALSQANANFNTAAQNRGFSNYWNSIAPAYDELLLAYITEGFRTLSVDLATFPSGDIISGIPHLPKYDRLFSRLWNVLERADIVVRGRGGATKLVRGNTSLEVKDSAQLSASLKDRFPQYEPEIRLLNLVGPKLAECVTGKANPVSIMFGTLESLKIMEDFYTNSPMMATLTDQLLRFFTILLRDTKAAVGKKPVPVRILEVGAGTGGTTTRLVEALDKLGVPVEYTFTDISTAFVSQAKRKFQKYPWLTCSVFNLENPIEPTFRGAYDIVIGANVVHATTDRTAACSRLRETLRDGGFIVLSEITRVIDWYDICFGLLDGWWLAEGGKGYPIQNAGAWMATFRRAGFREVGFSTGESVEAESQQLLVGWMGGSD